MRHLVKSASTLMLGTAVSQLVALAILPLISRIYGPTAFGEFSTYLVWIGLVIILATMQLQHALMLPKLHKHAIRVLRASLCTILLISICTSVVALVILGLWSRRTDAVTLAILIALATLTGGVIQVIQGYAIRLAAFTTIAYSSIVRVLSVGLIQCTLGWLGYGAKGLLLALIAGDVITILIITLVVRSHLATLFTRRSHWAGMIVAFRRYRDFAQYGVAQELLNSLSQGLPVLLLGYGYGQAAAGAYAATVRLIGAPVQLVGNATRQVVYRELAQNSRSLPERLHLFKVVTFWLMVPAGVAVLIACPWLGDFALLLLGKDWTLAGDYAPSLALWFAVAMGNSPATATFRIARRQDLSLYYNSFLLAQRALVLWLAILYTNSIVAVYLYAGVGVVMNLAYIALGYRVLRDNHQEAE